MIKHCKEATFGWNDFDFWFEGIESIVVREMEVGVT